MCSLWWAEEPPETCRSSVKINKFKKRCILLAVICNYIMKYGHINIKDIYCLLDLCLKILFVNLHRWIPMCLFRQQVDKALFNAFHNFFIFLFLLVLQNMSSIFVPFFLFCSFLFLFVHFCAFLFIFVPFCSFLCLFVYFCSFLFPFVPFCFFLLIFVYFCSSLLVFVPFCSFLFLFVPFFSFCSFFHFCSFVFIFVLLFIFVPVRQVQSLLIV